MQKLDPTTFRTMPWKNGGGITTEVLVLPPGATLDTFDVRVSFARIETDGPFSRFVGVDRTLVLLAGAGLTLAMSDDAVVRLDKESRPFAFTGGDSCVATLEDGPVEDVNVMTRRAALRHHAHRVTLDQARTLTCLGELSLFVVLTGSVLATDGAGEIALGPRDVLTVSPASAPVILETPSGPPANVLLVDITRR
jgi:environmental stress-induced protein Ves